MAAPRVSAGGCGAGQDGLLLLQGTALGQSGLSVQGAQVSLLIRAVELLVLMSMVQY